MNYSSYEEICMRTWKAHNMFELIKPDRTLDCIGLYCPEPVFRTRIEIDKLAVGQILEVFADDPAAEEDIKSLVNRLGQRLLEVSKRGSQLRFLIEKVDGR